MKKIFFFLLLASFASSSPVTAQTETTVVVGGRVVNGTSGAPVPTGLEVTVVSLGSTGDELARTKTSSGNDGLFKAEIEKGDRYLIATTHLEVTYTSVVTDPSGPVELKVFETTDDDSVVSVTSDTTTVIRGEDNVLEVLALMRVSNSSDRTYLGRQTEEGRSVLRFPVPPGAFDVNPGTGITSGVIAVPGGFTAADPLQPGELNAGYLYRVRASRQGWPMRRAFFYPTTRVTILIDESLRLSSPRLRFSEVVPIGEGEDAKRYRQYDGRSFSAGDLIEADITYPAEGPNKNAALYVGAIAGAIVLLAIAIVVPLRRRRRNPSVVELSERERLIEEIAALDQAFEMESIEEGEYTRRRNEMKSKLQTMTNDFTAR
ncbi:MAG: hypothetical protein KY429_00080 [Actinobacteria bacterium]|nr:hypothetical protein [Actinomycetota bacterium]